MKWLGLVLFLVCANVVFGNRVNFERYNFSLVPPPREGWVHLTEREFPSEAVVFAVKSVAGDRNFSVRVVKYEAPTLEGKGAFVNAVVAGLVKEKFVLKDDDYAELNGVPAVQLVFEIDEGEVYVNHLVYLIFAGNLVYNIEATVAYGTAENDRDLMAIASSFAFISEPNPPADVSGILKQNGHVPLKREAREPGEKRPRYLLGDSLGKIVLNLFVGFLASGVCFVLGTRRERTVLAFCFVLIIFSTGICFGLASVCVVGVILTMVVSMEMKESSLQALTKLSCWSVLPILLLMYFIWL